MRQIEKSVLEELFSDFGAKLSAPTTFCIVGSTASILLGQPDRQTPDIDIWEPQSDFDLTELKKACEAAGILFDPRGEIEPGKIYLQILRPGITMFPRNFPVEKLARFGNLTLVMPPAEMIVATKLARAEEKDLEDISWWMRERGLTAKQIEAAIDLIPQSENREAARNNLIFVELTTKSPSP